MSGKKLKILEKQERKKKKITKKWITAIRRLKTEGEMKGRTENTPGCTVLTVAHRGRRAFSPVRATSSYLKAHDNADILHVPRCPLRQKIFLVTVAWVSFCKTQDESQERSPFLGFGAPKRERRSSQWCSPRCSPRCWNVLGGPRFGVGPAINCPNTGITVDTGDFLAIGHPDLFNPLVPKEPK